MIRLLPARKYKQVLTCLIKNKIAGQNIYPFYASFKLTSRCQFKCPFCNIRFQNKPDSPTSKIKAVLDNLSRSSALLVSFEGGEPLLREDIGELLEYARSRSFYLLFTTSHRHLESFPIKAYGRLIDFLHISIDEGHDNLEMFSRLNEFNSLGPQLSVQVVVTRESLKSLEEKVNLVHAVKANIVIMPAVHMERTNEFFPDFSAFENEIKRLKRKYRHTVYTPDGYFEAVRSGQCSTASVIIDSDCRLYYPCHILEAKGPDLSTTDFMNYLLTNDAENARAQMKACTRQCGWFQYFSIGDFTSITSAFKSLRPAFSKLWK